MTNRKFKLLKSDTKIACGRTLYRIKAKISFGIVAKGDKGGYIEKEENLRSLDNAWVFGDAEVFGDARVSGNAEVPPLSITGLRYGVTITDTHMRIGCEYHSIKDWSKFTNERILEMDNKALVELWKIYKPTILELAKEHQRKAKEASRGLT